MVYFVLCGRYVKIGVAYDVENRLLSLQCGSVKKLKLLHAVPGRMELERQLHERFSADRVRPSGEWFSYCDEIKAFIVGQA